MRKVFRRTLLSVAWVCLAIGLGACGSSSDSDCPDLGGTWTVDQHCQATFVGQTFGATMDGCSFTCTGAFEGFSGTVTEDGSITLSGTIGTSTIHCTGNASTSKITLACDQECAVVMSK
jgi:polyisoprenoid-binding protein YceI